MLPAALFDAGSVRELDRIAIEEQGITGISLMRRAAVACVEVAQARWPEAKSALVYCGNGNNAGDGYLIAGILAQRDFKVDVVVVGDVDKLGADARKAYRFCQNSDAVINNLAPQVFSQSADLIFDALLGTGLKGPVRDRFAAVIDSINRQADATSTPVVAVDLPSGLSADSGRILGVAIRAQATVTFIGTKRGLLTADGPDHSGTLYFDDLEVPQAVFDRLPPDAVLLSEHMMKGSLPKRPRNSHKNKFGHILVVGGDEGMGGAVAMSAEAALRSGAGLVSVATHPTHAQALLVRTPELMVRGVLFDDPDLDKPNDTPEAGIGRSTIERLLNQCSVIVLGPGLGSSSWSRQMFEIVMSHSAQSGKPMVVDADGLNMMTVGVERRDSWILTPHPGEARRLISNLPASQNVSDDYQGIAEVELDQANADRFSMSALLHRTYGGAVILKGVGSLINDGEQISLCPYGNPGMSSAGMGDVLSGVAGALLGQGLSVSLAAKQAVLMHALAGDRAVAVAGERGLLATDLIPHLRKLSNEFDSHDR